jgi:hypothetical protein
MEATVRTPGHCSQLFLPAVKHQICVGKDGAVGPVTARSGTLLPSLARGFSATRSYESVLLQSVFRMKVSKGERIFACPGSQQGFLEARRALTNRWWLGRRLRVRQPLVNANFTQRLPKGCRHVARSTALFGYVRQSLAPPVFCLSTDLAFQGVILFCVFIMRRPDQERAA